MAWLVPSLPFYIGFPDSSSLFQLVALVVRAFFYIDISVISESFSAQKGDSPEQPKSKQSE